MMTKIKVRSVEELDLEEQIVELTEDEKNSAVDKELIHYDGKEWRFFLRDIILLENCL